MALLGRRGFGGLLLAILLLGVAIISWSTSKGPVRYEFQTLAFGALAEFRLEGLDRAAAEVFERDSQALLQRWHSELHPWQPGALQSLNAALAAGESQSVPQSIADLIVLSRELSRDSHGLFDPGIGALVAAWGFHREAGGSAEAPPDQAQLAALRAQRPSILDLELDDQGRARSDKRSLRLDFNGIAEGYALSRLGQRFHELGGRDGLFMIGGDLLLLGSNQGRPWRVAVRHPGGGVLAELSLHGDRAVCTAGTYARFRDDAGVRRGHLIDPFTGEPADSLVSVTVVHGDPVRADAAASALLIAGRDRWRELAQSMDLEQVWVLDAEGQLHHFPGPGASAL